MDVPGPGEDVTPHVGNNQRRYRAEGGQDGTVLAPGQRHRYPGGSAVADYHGADVDAFPGQLLEHEHPRRVIADRGDQRHLEPESRRSHRGDRGGTADLQGGLVHQLLLLAECGRHVFAEDEHIGVAVPDHHKVQVPAGSRPWASRCRFRR